MTLPRFSLKFPLTRHGFFTIIVAVSKSGGFCSRSFSKEVYVDHENDISAQEKTEKQRARLQKKNENSKRQKGTLCKKKKRQKSAVCLMSFITITAVRPPTGAPGSQNICAQMPKATAAVRFAMFFARGTPYCVAFCS